MSEYAIESITTVDDGAAVKVDCGSFDTLILVALDSDGLAFVVAGSSHPACDGAEKWLAGRARALDAIEQRALELRQYGAWSARRGGANV